MFAAPSGIPINVPGTSLRRAIAARDRLFATFDRLISQRRAQPRDDGLSTLLRAEAPGGERLDDAACRLELHHLVLAGYIVFGELVGALIQLDRHSDERARLCDEIDERASAGPVTTDTPAGPAVPAAGGAGAQTAHAGREHLLRDRQAGVRARGGTPSRRAGR